MKFVCLITAFLILIFSSKSIQAAPGDLDPTFGFAGKIVLTSGFSVGSASAAVQPDNKIVVIGGNTLARFTSDGLPDQSFGNSGYVTVFNYVFNDGKIQPDGKIVAVGHYWDFVYKYLAVGRFNTTGTIEFVYIYPIGYSTGNSLAIQSNGKLVVGGYVSNSPGTLDFLAMRLNTNGTLDTTFSRDGVFIADFYYQFSDDVVESVAVQADGKILLAGSTFGNANAMDFGLMRLNSNGTLDNSFGFGGRTTLNFSGLDDFAYDAVIQPDGKIVAAGSAKTGNTYGGSNQRFALARFNNDGSLDTTFGISGKVLTNFGILSNDVIRDIALQTDGRIVAAGYQAESVNNSNFALARYNTNGTIDTSFSGNGRQTTDFYGGNDYAQAAVFQSDGKIVAAGYALNGNYYNIALARYLP